MVVAKIVRVDGKWSPRLPDFADEEREFSVRRNGDSVILEPILKTPSWDKVLAWLETETVGLDPDFIEAVTERPGAAEQRDFHLLD